MSSCEKYQELISRMIDGDLSTREEADLARHLDECPACAALFSAFSAVSRQIGSDLEEPPAELLENVMADVRREEIRRKNRLPTVIRSVLSVAAVAAVIVGVYWGVNLSRSTQPATLSAAAYESGAAEETAATTVTEDCAEEAAEPEVFAGRGIEAAPASQSAMDAVPMPTQAPMPNAVEKREVPAEESATYEDALPVEEDEAAPEPAPLPEPAPEAEDGTPVWDLSAWDLSLLRDMLGGKPTELDPAELEAALLGRILVRDQEQVLSVPVYSRDGVLYYLDPLRGAVYQAELSPAELMAFLGENN